ncbi:MAG TPA: type II CAAX endopeptidase family protein [Syntrophorhabdaceae bacterium]|nr:type II CAAX endopeptidase family protein [Syntrophorhabdaceae bacterium]HQM81789.1 type II CAAX endopeptidase family protein [Syntrophorhabdaceae bacterium]
MLVLIFSVLLAFFLWHTTFILRPFNFWLTMTFNTALLSAISFAAGKVPWQKREWGMRNIGIGIFAAIVLYGIFWLGHQVLILANTYTGLLPQRAENLSAIYASRAELPQYLVAALLFFPIGFGEEIYWRGFVQRSFQERWGKGAALLFTVILYTAVHLSTGNPVLILAAFICGIYWSGLYWYTGSLVPVLISHMLWDPFIFVIAPIQ